MTTGRINQIADDSVKRRSDRRPARDSSPNRTGDRPGSKKVRAEKREKRAFQTFFFSGTTPIRHGKNPAHELRKPGDSALSRCRDGADRRPAALHFEPFLHSLTGGDVAQDNTPARLSTFFRLPTRWSSGDRGLCETCRAPY